MVKVNYIDVFPASFRIDINCLTISYLYGANINALVAFNTCKVVYYLIFFTKFYIEVACLARNAD